MFTVIISEKGGQASTLDFNKTEITIGRMKGNDIVLPKGNVSKQHTRIFMRDSGFYVLDLKSTNGTYVNGRKVVNEQPIAESDKVYIGDFILQVGRAQVVPKGPPPAPPRATGGFPSAQQDRIGLPNAPAMGAGPLKPPTTPPVSDRQYAKTEGPSAEPFNPALLGGMPDPVLDFDAMPSEADFKTGADRDYTPVPSSAPIRPAPAEPIMPSSEDFKITNAGPAGTRPSPGRQPASPALVGSGAPVAAPAPSPGLSPRQHKGEPIIARPAAPGPMAVEFDADFHAAQYDVARVLFETLKPDDLPLAYPPSAAERARCESAVRGAIAKVTPRVDRELLAELLTSECVGLGPVESYLDDGAVADIYVNRYDRVLVRRGTDLVVAQRAFSHPDFLTLAAQRLLGSRDVVVGADEVRFSDGTRVHIVMPPIAVDGPVLTVRKPRTSHRSLEDLVAGQVLSAGMAQFLEHAVRAGRSILVAGPTQSGRSSLVSALLAKVPNGTRIISIEQNSHLSLPQDTAVRLEASLANNFDMRYLLRSAVAMHPDRIIVDECRGAEAYDWVTSAACGTEGSMMTLHGTSAPDALGRLESLCLLGSTDISPRGLREQIARAANLVVVVNNTPSKGFRVQQITEIQGVDLDAFRLNDVFYYRLEGASGAFHPTGYIPMFVEDIRHGGVSIDLSIFRE